MHCHVSEHWYEKVKNWEIKENISNMATDSRWEVSEILVQL